MKNKNFIKKVIYYYVSKNENLESIFIEKFGRDNGILSDLLSFIPERRRQIIMARQLIFALSDEVIIKLFDISQIHKCPECGCLFKNNVNIDYITRNFYCSKECLSKVKQRRLSYNTEYFNSLKHKKK